MITEKKDLTVKLTENECKYILDSLQAHASQIWIDNDEFNPAPRLYALRLLEIKDKMQFQIKNK
jgi:hypothetical protein